MAAPEANIGGVRGAADMGTGHPPSGPPRHLQNFNTFQFVSQLVSATPPYLFNMSSPFPGNFFSDLLRRMAPRAGTPGLPLDANLQQQIRAALLAKSGPPTSLPPMHGSLDPSTPATGVTPHLPSQTPVTPVQDKGIKRSLFSDVNALISCDDDTTTKRPRLEETREERHSENLSSPFLMQTPFLPSHGAPPSDVLNPWSRTMIRPQVPIPPHVSAAPLDPYRLLLDLRLAGQLRNMAASHVLQNKEPPVSIAGPGHAFNSSISGVTMPIPTTRRPSPPIPKTENNSSSIVPPSGSLRATGDDRVSAFHPPGRTLDSQDSTDEEAGEPRSSSRSSGSSNGSRESVGPQYIFRHLTQIYRSIDGQKDDSVDSKPLSVGQDDVPPHSPGTLTENIEEDRGESEKTFLNGQEQEKNKDKEFHD